MHETEQSDIVPLTTHILNTGIDRKIEEIQIIITAVFILPVLINFLDFSGKQITKYL